MAWWSRALALLAAGGLLAGPAAGVRELVQIQCMFRHGARAPAVLMPPWDTLFGEQFGANALDLTEPGANQMRALGEVLAGKMTATGLTGDFMLDRSRVALRTAESPRAMMSTQAVAQVLFPDSAVFVTTMDEDADELLNHHGCAAFETAWDTAFPAALPFVEALSEDGLVNLTAAAVATYGTAEPLGLWVFRLQDLYESAHFHGVSDDAGVMDTLTYYADELYAGWYAFFDQVMAADGAKPLGAALLSEVVYHATLDDALEHELSCADEGGCALVLYGGYDYSIRMLGNAVNMLSTDNVLEAAPLGGSLCFEVYEDSASSEKTVDILWGEPVEDANSTYGYRHEQHALATVRDGDLVATACRGGSLAEECSLDDIATFAAQQLAAAPGCCERTEGTGVAEAFWLLGCDEYTQETSTMNPLCSVWRSLCPATSCEDEEGLQVWSVVNGTCVATGAAASVGVAVAARVLVVVASLVAAF